MTKRKPPRLIAAVIMFAAGMWAGSAHAGGIYDPEIAAMRAQFGAYIAQSEKNIAALTKLYSAYDRTADAMQDVVGARRMLQGRCPTDTKEKLLGCLAKQYTAISFLDLYVRQGLAIMPDALKDAATAGSILAQDVSGHVGKLQGIADGFKTWNDVIVPALRKQFDTDREALKSLYSADFTSDYRFATDRQAALDEAALLSFELTEAAKRLQSRGQGFLAEHRVGHALLTARSIQWLSDQVPVMWKALDVDVQKDAKVDALKAHTKSALDDAHKSLVAAAGALDAASERQAALSLLKSRVTAAKLTDRDRKAFSNLYTSIDGLKPDLVNRDAVVDTLIERGFIWLGAVSR